MSDDKILRNIHFFKELAEVQKTHVTPRRTELVDVTGIELVRKPASVRKSRTSQRW